MKNLFENLKDEKYKKFQKKLIPNIGESTIIGVKIPEIRKIAKNFKDDKFLRNLPHKYLEENFLHAILISNMKNYDETIKNLDRFLPFVDNWCVCDAIIPKTFKKHLNILIEDIKRRLKSKYTYEVRFAIKMLMTHYLDEEFKEQYNDTISKIKSDEYYINMCIAWYFATALAKQYDKTIKYIEEKKLEKWVHNKTIQKAIESFRINDERKQYLKTLKL